MSEPQPTDFQCYMYRQNSFSWKVVCVCVCGVVLVGGGVVPVPVAVWSPVEPHRHHFLEESFSTDYCNATYNWPGSEAVHHNRIFLLPWEEEERKHIQCVVLPASCGGVAGRSASGILFTSSETETSRLIHSWKLVIEARMNMHKTVTVWL